MKLDNYKQLIKNLPVRQQCFTIIRKNKKWQHAENNFHWFKDCNDNYFQNGELEISRQDLFNISNSTREKILKTIFWGYPNGMHAHDNFAGILSNIDRLEGIFIELQNSNHLTRDDLNKTQAEFKSISGLGLSTYSKLLYFFEIKINNIPCLIVDNRILDVFKSNTYKDFTSLLDIKGNPEKRYFDFINVLDDVAKRLETRGENIEQFLFLFGSKLKP